MTISLILMLLCLGCVVGFLAGLLGIGGGLLCVPALTFLMLHLGVGDTSVHMAIGSASATILFTSFSSALTHYRRGAVLNNVWIMVVPGLLIGGVIGAQISGFIPKIPLACCFVLFTAFSATKMLLGGNPKPSRSLPGRFGLFNVGGIIGTASALIGAGGGFLSVPFLVWCNVNIRNAVATSAAMGLPIALASAIGYVISGWGVPGRPEYALGFIYWPAVLAIVVTSMIFAPLGARAAHTWNTSTLRKCFAFLLYFLGAYMLYRVVVS